MKLKTKKIIPILCVFLVFIAISSTFSIAVTYANSKHNGITIVLDAGHGGRDGGSIGANGTIEKNINLDYTLALKQKLVQNNFEVQLTRQNDDGLYSPTAKNKKLSDMNARFKIIEKANPALVVSIHMNSFSDPQAKGAITYFRKGDTHGEYCASLIQQSLNTYCKATLNKPKIGDYYILNCNYYTAVLVECGFISNPKEEELLNTNEYKSQIINAIYNGIIMYFG